MTCVRHHNVTQSSYIVVKTLCALPSPHQEDTPDVAPSAPGLMQKLPLLRGSKTKQSNSRHPGEAPQGKRWEPTREQNPRAAGSRRGFPRRPPARPDSARARQTEKGRGGRAALPGIGRRGPSCAGREFWPRTRVKGPARRPEECAAHPRPGRPASGPGERGPAHLATGCSPAQPPPGARARARRAAGVGETMSLHRARARGPAQEVLMALCWGKQTPRDRRGAPNSTRAGNV